MMLPGLSFLHAQHAHVCIVLLFAAVDAPAASVPELPASTSTITTSAFVCLPVCLSGSHCLSVCLFFCLSFCLAVCIIFCHDCMQSLSICTDQALNHVFVLSQVYTQVMMRLPVYPNL